MIRTLSVFPKDPSVDSKGKGLLADAKEFLHVSTISEIRCVKRYYLEEIIESEFVLLRDKLLVESVWQEYREGDFYPDHPYKVEVAYKPGMMNPEVRSLMESAAALGISSLKAADSCFAYYFFGESLDPEEVHKVVDKLIMNSLIEEVRNRVPETLMIQGQVGTIRIIPIREMADEALISLSEHTLFLTLPEMQTIRAYFQKLGRDPYDGELETLAQTWSEHCGHKTFKAKLIIDGEPKEPLFRRLKEATKAIAHPRVVSCFVDNAGVFQLNEAYGITAKVETHNSPSALDPYGGAGTGSGGVFRDAAGTGKGAKVIAGTDIFCVGPWDLPQEDVPEGSKHPRFILKGLVRGVADYGNPMGIPTNNGSVHVHPDFRAKPTVIVGAYGLIKLKDAQKGSPQSGDLIVAAGGRTGRDGIHGATFSSAEMTEQTEKVNSSAVQIGDPIAEKRLFDALLELTECGLVRAVTDCGAGGLSSAIGEMGSEIGVEVDLEKAPLKYVGMDPWEIWISESQERMVLAIDPAQLNKVQSVFFKHSVEAAVLGVFTGDQHLRVNYGGQPLCDLSMEFVHEGLSPLELEGTSTSSSFREPSLDVLIQSDYTESLKRVLSHPNVCSKEPILRRYDHNIQGTAVQMPLAGKTHSGPNNASVIEPVLGRGDGLVLGHGLNPILNRMDPYKGSKWAIFEAVSNVVSQGADPEAIALIDNFIWPKPDSKYLADLSHSVDACVDVSKALGMPFISGKDSLSSTYRKGDQVIHIPPVLCVSALGVISDISKTISSPFKTPGNKIVLLGTPQSEMGGSVYFDTLNYVGNHVPDLECEIAFETFKRVHHGIVQGWIRSCADVSEGGLAAALAELCFGDLVGARLVLEDGEFPDYALLFSESPGRFVVEVAPADFDALRQSLGSISCLALGEITADGVFSIQRGDRLLIQESVSELMTCWQEPMRKVFG